MNVMSRADGLFRASAAGVALALVFVVSAASGARALTASESEMGEFSSSWWAPTVISGASTITGTGSGNNYDILRLTGLAPGAQTLTLSFAAPEGVDYSYSAGGAIKWDFSAFDWGWDGNDGGSVQVDYYTRSQTVTLALSDAFSGELWLGLYFTHGSSLAYTILATVAGASDTLPGDAPSLPDLGGGEKLSAPVPLPPALALMGGTLAGLGLFARRRRGA